MSITITCRFDRPAAAQQAAERLRRRGYMVSSKQKPLDIPADPLLVAYPYGSAGGSTAGNSLMGALPPLSGNGVMLHTPKPQDSPVLSVLTDDTGLYDARQLLTALGGKILF